MVALVSQSDHVGKFLVGTSPDPLKYSIHILERQVSIIFIFNKFIIDSLIRLDKPSGCNSSVKYTLIERCFAKVARAFMKFKYSIGVS